MVSKEDSWVRIFDVPNISTHKKGFTLYRIISMLYPKSSPDAVSKVTVWKRFNDFRKLHREMRTKHQALHMKSKFPILPNKSFFKRFDEDVIEQRRQSILNFLEFVGSQPQLFLCSEFLKFFESSHTPNELLNSSISTIRAGLNLPEEAEYCLCLVPNSDEDQTVSDTESISTVSSLSSSLQTVDFGLESCQSTSSLTKLTKKLIINSSKSSLRTNDSQDSESITLSNDSVHTLEGQIFPPPDTPQYTDISKGDYVKAASEYFEKANILESEKGYKQAFKAYKIGLEVLLSNVKEDSNLERRDFVRYLIEKNLLRAEKIYNIYLSSDTRTVHDQIERKMDNVVQRTSAELYKYKVLKIISNGMLVLHRDSQQLYYIKVLYKTYNFSNNHLVLPQNVPFMVQLYNYYHSENAIFLVLQYCSGVKLCDYMSQNVTNSDDVFIRAVNSPSTSSDTIYCCNKTTTQNNSHQSYSELVNEYATEKSKKLEEPETTFYDKQCAISNTSCNINSISTKERLENSSTCDIINSNDQFIHKSAENLDIDYLLTKSQQLLSSVNLTLKKNNEVIENKAKTNKDLEKCTENMNKKPSSSQRKSSSSIYDDFDCFELPKVSLPDVVKWSSQLLLALEKLHKFGVICRDLQFKNLLIDDNGDLVLTYMCNLSEVCDAVFNKDINLVLAPELCSIHPVTAAVDWWSFGVILYELLVGMPLKYVHPEGLTTHSSLKIPKYVTVEGKSLLKQLLVYEPRERLGCGINGTEDLKSHPFFNSVDWNSLASI